MRKGVEIKVMSSERLKAEINRVVIAHVQLDDIELGTAVDYLVQVGSQTHPDQPFQFPFDTSSASLDNRVLVNLHGRNIPYGELISKVCAQGGLKWEVKRGCIVIINDRQVRPLTPN